MNKYIAEIVFALGIMCSIQAVAVTTTASAAAPAPESNPTCKQIEAQCEHALELKKALMPYFDMCLDASVKAYAYAHDVIQNQVPETVLGYTSPYVSDATASNYIAHGTMALGGIIVFQGLKAMTALPMAIVKLPFSNRPTMFLSGVIAKTIYDSYTQQTFDKKDPTKK